MQHSTEKFANVARRNTRWMTLIGVTALALMPTIGVAGATTQTSGQVLAKPCGFSKSGGRAWYNHCTTDGSRIQIRVDNVAGIDANKCVGPGETVLGWAFEYRNAWYTGRLC
jgi:hypothetical protein